MLSHLKRRIGVFTAVAVMAALVPALASSPASAAPLTTAADPESPSTYLACPGSANIPSAGFTDTTSTDVDCIKMFNITQGKTTTTYDPSASVTREEMALFLSRMYTPTGLAAGTGTFTAFTDITGLAAATQTAINSIARAVMSRAPR